MTTRAQHSESMKFYGKYRGIVMDNQDPMMRARIRAEVPAVLGDVPTGWALPCFPYTGDGSGFHAVPELGTGVWVEFEGGDPSYPIWTGGWYETGQVPRRETSGASRPPLKLLRSSAGLLLAFDDSDGTITLSDASGTNLLTIETKEGQLRIKTAAKTVIESPLIELVENATHPVAFGDLLLQYLNQLVALFNAHLHVGERVAGVIPVTPAPPATPFPPAPPSLISTRVKSG